MREDVERDYVDYVTRRLPVLRRTAYLLCGDAHRADDIVQATTTALYRSWRRVQAADNIDAYVHRVLVRKYLDDKRLRWSQVRLMWQPPDVPEHSTSRIEDRELLRAALARLPRGQRTVLVLRFVLDLSIEQVAELVDSSPSNVKSNAARGLVALRRLIDRHELIGE